jgi:hypothetical protein
MFLLVDLPLSIERVVVLSVHALEFCSGPQVNGSEAFMQMVFPDAEMLWMIKG